MITQPFKDTLSLPETRPLASLQPRVPGAVGPARWGWQVVLAMCSL